MTKNILNLLDLVLEVPQGVDRLRELILGLAFEGQLSDDPTKADWDMDRNLKDLGKMIRGITYAKSESRKDQDDNLTPLLGAANIQQEINYSNLTYVPSKLIKSEQLLLNGDILICMSSGSKHLVGKAAPVQDPIRASFGAFCAVYRSTSLVDSNFLALFFQSPKYRKEISSSSRGIGINNLRIGDIESISIPLPPLKEQVNIVNRVSELLNLCNELHTSRNFQSALATSVRKSAVSAISAAQTPEELQIAWDRIEDNWEVIAGTTESIESLRELILDVLFKPKKIDEREIRSFGDLLTISNGDRSKNYPSKEFRVSTGIPFVNAGHLKDGRIDLSEMDYISREKYESLSGGKFQDGDILFCLRGSLGKSALVKNFGEGTIASSLAIFRVGGEIDAEYLFWFLQSGMARLQIKKFDNGTAQPNLAAKSVLKFEIPLPKLSEQKSIVNKVTELMKICDQLQQKLIQKEEVADKFARSVVSASA
jgi:type I restriction enzyme S subunit